MRRPNVPIMPDDSADDAQAWRYFRQRDFTGGENRQLLPEFLAPNQLLIALNCVMTPDGVPETRTGKSLVHTDPIGAGKITSVHRFAKENGTSYVVEQFGTALYAYAYDGTTQFVAPTQIATGLNAAKFRSVVWKDKLILTNGVDNVKTWDGTTLADLGGSPPKSKMIAIYGAKLWLVDVANVNQLRFSGVENPATWDALDVIKLRDGDGDEISGLSPQTGALIVFKNNSVWPIYGTGRDDFRIPETPLSDRIGCVAPDTVLDAGFFLGANNLYTFDLNGVSEVSDTHRVVIENMLLADKQAAFAVHQSTKKRILLHLGTQILCIDGRYKCITSWDNLNAACFAVLDAKGDDGSILVGDASGGNLYKLDNSITDDGMPIITTIQTAYLDYESVNRKIWRWFQPEIESLGSVNSSITLAFDVDYSKLEGLREISDIADNTMTWGDSNWGEASWGKTLRIVECFYLHIAKGNRVSFRVTALDRIKFFGYMTKYRETGAL